VPVLDIGKTRTGRLWTTCATIGHSPVARRRRGSTLLPDRARRIRAPSGPLDGLMQADAYSGFNGLYAPAAAGADREVACWASSRDATSSTWRAQQGADRH